MLFEFLAGLLTLLLVVDTLYKRRRHVMIAKAGIRGPTPLPLFGNMLHFVGNTTANAYDLFDKLTAKYGKVVRMWMGNHCVLFVRDAKFFEDIFKSQQLITKNNLYDLLSGWLGQGLLLSTGPKWFSRRKIITPTFHFKILEEFVEIFDQQSHVMVKSLMEKADGKTVVHMFPKVCLMALDIITETAMGVKVHAQEHPEFPYAKAVTDTSNIMSDRFVKPFDRFDGYFRIFHNQKYHQLQNNIKIMHDFTDKVINERREALQKSIDSGTYQAGSSVDEMGIKKRMAFLDVLLQSTVGGKPLTNKDIREEVDTFMFEGHDTTTSGICFTLYLLSRHPDVQQKVLEEIHSVIGEDKEKPVTMKDLQELKYLDCVIKESQRLYPSVPTIGRVTEQDVVINGVTIPANTNITLLMYAAMKDPDYFPKPEEFLPERFMNTEDKINPFAYVPFSAGPRNCIGQKFAMAEMKSTVSKMVRHFELLPLGEEVKPVMNMVLRSETDAQLGLRVRK
ncbi:probable cytochrome P450 4d14 precursor [Musca domestica]|uniref:Cytochrome P450 n=1 Tax=Musca domestica TaxID=7370 RepID=A8DY22_MUSDO|nr:probable cytochrome P450 4d14 precursor [Musca domestica]ABV48807.1 cytochrome P450 CYP4D4v2 [Musca domestica]